MIDIRRLVVLICLTLGFMACAEDVDISEPALECFDSENRKFLPTNWYHDADGDRYGNHNWSILSCRGGRGWVNNAGDCNDSRNDIHPNATEVCDGKDNDCDGRIDEGLRWYTYYRDADGDGFGVPSSRWKEACDHPGEGWADNAGDCNDSRNDIHPNATEVCDDIDNDCDGRIDEGFDKTWWPDADDDGYGDPSGTPSYGCNFNGKTINNLDCDDNRAAINPDAWELCDGVDNNCNGLVDDNDHSEGYRSTAMTWYNDADGDGFGDPASPTKACTRPTGHVTNADDCDDTSTLVGGARRYFRDVDGDGFGDLGHNVVSCVPLIGFVQNGLDCNDGDATIGEGRTFYLDKDGDGYGAYVPITIAPDAVRSCASGTTLRQCHLFICNDYVPNDDDCDDSSNKAKPNNPASSEIIDGYDNDCDGTRDGTGGFYLCNSGAGTRYYRYDSADDDCDDIRACAPPTASWSTTSCY